MAFHFVRPIFGFSRRLTRLIRSAWIIHSTSLQNKSVCWAGANRCGRGCVFSIIGRSRLHIDRGVNFADGSRVFIRNGVLEIGERSFIGYGTIIASQDSIHIGCDALIAEYVTIRDQDHTFEEAVANDKMFTTAPVVIGDNVWLGAKVTVTKGVTIGDNTVIGANSVVTRDIPPNVLAAGVPARVIRDLKPEDRAGQFIERQT